MADPPKKLKLPSSIDQGWATVIAAILAIVGTIITLWLQRDTAVPTAPVPSVVAAITATPTQTINATIAIETPTLAVTPSITSTIVASSDPTPTPQIVSQLPPAQKTIVQKASEALFQVAQALPLIVKDDFENNDYSWPIANNIYNGGIECNTAIKESAYHINIRSTDGPAYCMAGLTKVAKDFIVSADQQIVNKRNADIFLYYRVSDDGRSFYHVVYNPQTQIFSAGITKDGQQSTIIASTYVEEINTNGINKITLLALGSSHVVYLNDKLIAIFTDDQLAQGQLRFTIQLQEAHQEEILLIDHFDLRGN
jgi:hypothetical protein